ncbi:MAG: hypothetical protein PHC66_02910 [Candidatus Nanoarchaeia archaeon]|nr:hypothetical protein [Candidatus Nanoarchaeia archaeon]MDD5239011.1 hypothetical protein [Candidatus Nanoarchaeia archaeon]
MNYGEREKLESILRSFTDELRCPRTDKKPRAPEEFKTVEDKTAVFGRNDMLRYYRKGELEKRYQLAFPDLQKGDYVAIGVRLGMGREIIFSLETLDVVDYIMSLESAVLKALAKLKQNYYSAGLCEPEMAKERAFLEDSVKFLKDNVYMPKSKDEIKTGARLDVSNSYLEYLLRNHAQIGFWGVDRNIVMLDNIGPSFVYNPGLVQELEKKKWTYDEEFPKIRDVFDKKENQDELLRLLEENNNGIGDKRFKGMPAQTLFEIVLAYLKNGCGCYEYSKKKYLERFETALLCPIKTTEPANEQKKHFFMDI